VFFLKRCWQRATGGEVVFSTRSSVNGEVVVKRDLLGLRVVAGGLTQSGGQVEIIWRRALRHLLDVKPRPWRPGRVLLLGLGAGTSADLVRRLWPKSRLVAVELDEVMIEIGKRFFSLAEMDNFTIRVTDAVDYVTSGAGAEGGVFDLILVDLYLGQTYPAGAETDLFLGRLREMVADGGEVIFNRLNYDGHRRATLAFFSRTGRHFSHTAVKRVGGNLLIYAGNGVEYK
jgi:spermidine synthase